MSEIQEHLERHAEMKEIRAIEEPHWREIAMMIRPDDRDFDAHVQRRRDDSAIFDATPIYALDNFAGGIFSQLTNPMNRWFGLGIADKDLERWQPVAQWLYRHTDRLLATFTDAVSPFYSEVKPWLANLGAFGWSCMYNEEMPGEARIVDRSIPIGETFIATDALGFTTTVHREFSLNGRQAKQKFKTNYINGMNDDKHRYVFVHCVYPNPDYVPKAIGHKGAKYLSCYVSPDLQDFSRDGFYYELPYQIPQWNRRSGRPYPTGPGHLARADIAMLQDMERTHIVAGQFAAEPPLLVHDMSVITAADIEPNAVLYGTMNAESGKRIIDVLSRGTDVKLSMAQSEQRRNAIRQAFYFSVMQLMNRPEMTATEFLGFQKEMLQLMAPNLVQIQQGGLSPLIARRWNILMRAGQIEPPPAELAGHEITVNYVSPLAKLMKVAEAQGVSQFLSAVAPVVQARPETADKLNGDRIIDILRDGLVSDPSVTVDDATVAKIRQARAQQQQQAIQLQAAEQAANIGATVSHAQQAATLAKKRTAA